MKKNQITFLQIAIFVSFLFLALVISPFLTTLILAAILVTGTMPIHDWVLRKVHGRKIVAAVIMSLSIGIIFSITFFLFIILLSQEAVSIYQSFEQLLREGYFNISDLVDKLSKFLSINPSDILSSITQAAQNFSTILVTQGKDLIASLAWLFLNFFVLVFTMYFFFKDGKSTVEFLQRVIPLPHQHAKEIFHKFKQVSLAMLYGIFLTAIIQGILGGIGLWVAGIHNPIFWGTLMALLGMLPIGGTGIVWLPAAVILIIENHYFAGVGLLLWGALIVAFVDNLIKPLVISKQTNLSPLATFLVVIGGLIVFGLKGAIIAPMVLASLVSLMHIHKMETPSSLEPAKKSEEV
ncbi:AI-2E family transporter [Candidatus Gracilibacteria bacterium]|nr:AI-2E family transporter [Candidatus Gracilibacteria bacterium]